jgi:hypothetical protein
MGFLFFLLVGGIFIAGAQGRTDNSFRIDELLKKRPPSSNPHDFTINRFFSDILIERDSSVTVKETIEVEFHRPRHGIYRDIPYRYRDDLGKPLETPLRILSVTNKSRGSWEHKVDKQGPMVHIRIGDPKKFMEGRQTYVITYRVENVLRYFEDHDEFYWNVTGNAWPAPIRESAAQVLIRGHQPGGPLRAACYTGPLGSREAVCGQETLEQGAAFYSKKNLNIGEGLTVVLGWDKGVVTPPSAWRKFSWILNFRENWVFLFPIFMALFMVRHWAVRGRDPQVRESLVVQYQPPQTNERSLNPGEIGALVDEKVDSRDLTASLIGLAVKGFILVEEIKKEGWIFDTTDYELSRLKAADSSLSPFERELLDRLFTSGPKILISDLKNKFYTHLNPLRNQLFNDLVAKKIFLQSPEAVRLRYRYTGLAVLGLGLAGMVAWDSPWKPFLAFSLIGLPLLFFSRFMPVKTLLGARTRLESLGFQEFLSRAEKDRLERMADPHLFSRYLPYALALGVVDNWARAFKGVYQEPPDWYSSPDGFHSFNTSSFSHSINQAASAMTTALLSAPRGGGSGGGFSGGSSGGGFGGGGGGSW